MDLLLDGRVRQLLPEPVDDPDLHEVYARDWVDIGGVRANFVTAVDGAVRIDGGSRGLQSRGDRRVFAVLRDLADVVLVGRGTAVAETYPALTTAPRRACVRADYGLARDLPTAVVSRSLALDPAGPLFDYRTGAPRTVVVTVARSHVSHALAAVADVVVAGDDALDVGAMLTALRERGWTRVLTEGGPSLFAALLDAGAVDELCHTVVPRLVGGDGGIVPGPLAKDRRLTHLSLLEDAGTLLHRYRVRR